MEDQFLAFVADVMEVDANELSLATQYKSYAKWDSIMMLTLIMELEAQYNVSIPVEKVNAVRTLDDLWKLVQ